MEACANFISNRAEFAPVQAEIEEAKIGIWFTLEG
jgi:hypothetical protein